MKVTQASINPTNKLTAATLSVALLNVVRVIIEGVWPNTTDQAMWIALDPVAVFLVGWFIKDEANISVPVVVETPVAPTPSEGQA
ncbi:MAG: hypothetical protein WC829_10710 [Hyphomicrobium sp.]|jgi:hypothetical protein